jgi:hypothetical protein
VPAINGGDAFIVPVPSPHVIDARGRSDATL